jgi:hypothetical protein
MFRLVVRVVGWVVDNGDMHVTYMVISVGYVPIESGIAPVSRLLAKLLCTICSNKVHMAARIRLRLGCNTMDSIATPNNWWYYDDSVR